MPDDNDNPYTYYPDNLNYTDTTLGTDSIWASDSDDMDIYKLPDSPTDSLVAIATAQAVLQYASPIYAKTPYHTSALSGYAWVCELLDGHPERICCKLGVHKHVFRHLIADLQMAGHSDSHCVTIKEQLAIFLYTCVTGLTTRHVGGRFQRSNETITKYFKKMLKFFSSPPFYTNNVFLPNANAPVAPYIHENPRFFPFFQDAIGAIDGTHIACTPNVAERVASINYKGTPSQNCLVACSFDMHFFYVYSGWEGSTADSTMFTDARIGDLYIPPGKYYLANAGFPSCNSLLVLFRGVRFHLVEDLRADDENARPTTPEELYNLRHASARNVVERIFGVLKARFKILLLPPHYDIDIQAQIPPTLAAVHNFIWRHDLVDAQMLAAEFEQFERDMCTMMGEIKLGTGPPQAAEVQVEQPEPEPEPEPERNAHPDMYTGELGSGPPQATEQRRAWDRQELIAQTM